MSIFEQVDEGRRLLSIPESIDDTLTRVIGNGFLRCESCGGRRTVGDVSPMLRNGWPRCCGYTMRLWTQQQVDSGEAPS